MLMDIEIILSLLGLLFAIAGFALDVVALVIATRKGKRPGNGPPLD
jgi:hypothetical protein